MAGFNTRAFSGSTGGSFTVNIRAKKDISVTGGVAHTEYFTEEFCADEFVLFIEISNGNDFVGWENLTYDTEKFTLTPLADGVMKYTATIEN